jgi:uncharacterized protein (TIGR03435 family)
MIVRFLAGVLVLCAGVRAQPRAPAFDAAEIKPVKAAGDARVSGDFQHGRLVVHNATLHMMINTAYGVRFDLITGGPNWIDTDLFDLAAVADPATTDAESRLMLRTLIEERFHLAVHHDSRPRAVYALLPAKTGVKLQPLPPDSPGRAGCHGFPLACHKFNMTDLAAMLPNIDREIDRPVLDLTGIEGRFDFTLDWGGRSGRGLPDALADLGLRLEPRKEAVDYLVVDRAERLREEP